MDVLTEFDAKTLSRVGSKTAYGILLSDLARENEKVYAISADIDSSAGLLKMLGIAIERFMNVGIVGENLIRLAASLAKEGFVPFASFLGNSVIRRCFDKVRMDIGCMNLNVKLVGFCCDDNTDKSSYCGMEDVAILRTIPNLAILQPSDCGMIKKCLYAAADFYGPVYIRLTQKVCAPIIYKDDFEFEIGRAIRLRDGKDVAIVATGNMVFQSLKAAEMLAEKSLECTVVDMHTTKPLDEEIIESLCAEHDLIVTVEEHGVVGGLGSAVAEFRTTLREPSRQLIVGLTDHDITMVASQFGKYELSAESIAERIFEKFSLFN